MAVFAHPDDETFICGGTLAKFAASGHRVVLVCATKGEMGRRLGVPPIANRETLPDLREAELRTACDALGVSELRLLGLRDKTLEINPREELAERVRRELERVRPGLVITFHERLGGHPDHCAIGRAATDAFQAYQSSGAKARLWFVAWGGMVRGAGREALARVGLDLDAVNEVDVSRELPEKLAAFRAHRTQSQMQSELWGPDAKAQKGLADREYFIHY